jgi:hypothetical protein
MGASSINKVVASPWLSYCPDLASVVGGYSMILGNGN